jgi:hypothetical protein
MLKTQIMKLRWNALYNHFIGQDGVMYSRAEAVAMVIRHQAQYAQGHQPNGPWGPVA